MPGHIACMTNIKALDMKFCKDKRIVYALEQVTLHYIPSQEDFLNRKGYLMIDGEGWVMLKKDGQALLQPNLKKE